MDTITSKIQSLGDLELAVLLSLVAENHCIITTQRKVLDDLASELQIVASRIFNVSCALVKCSPSTTLDDFREGVLVDAPEEEDDMGHQNLSPHHSLPSIQYLSPRQSLFRNGSGTSNSLDERRVANIVIAKDLNLASHNVQTQALELIRTRRLFSHTAMHGASKDFLVIALQASGSEKLTRHLNDLFAISHHHFPEDGFPNLEESSTPSAFNDAASMSSVIKTPRRMGADFEPITTISPADIKHLRRAASEVRMTAEVAAYLHNISLFLRLSRYVTGGVSAQATKHLRTVCTALAPLHGLAYCPPSLVALATRKVYPHRIVLATDKTERSLQWGSDPRVIREALKGVTAEDAINDTLANVEAPL